MVISGLKLSLRVKPICCMLDYVLMKVKLNYNVPIA